MVPWLLRALYADEIVGVDHMRRNIGRLDWIHNEDDAGNPRPSEEWLDGHYYS